jgi:hypothetical protein
MYPVAVGTADMYNHVSIVNVVVPVVKEKFVVVSK